MLRLLQECLNGKALGRDEAFGLTTLQGEELSSLLATAARLRDLNKGRVVTFSPKIFVPLTNLCRDFCGYCTFRKAPDESGAKTMTLDEVLRVVRQGKALGCTEVLFSLGDKPEAIYPEMKSFLNERGHQRTLDYLYEACRVVLEETGLLPHSNPGVMGQGDLQRLRDVNPSMGLMLESVSERLLLAGAAHDNAPDKKPAVRLRTLETAGKLRVPFTTGILIGIGENWQERIDSPLAPDFINPEAPWPALRLLQEKSAQAGFELKARLPIYPEYIREEFLQPSLFPFVERLCGPDGLIEDGGPLANLPVQHSNTPLV